MNISCHFKFILFFTTIHFIALFFSNSYGQFAIVLDKDGYCTIRSTPEAANNIMDTLSSGYLIYAFENKGNWTNINYSIGDKNLYGYIYKDRIQYISEYTDISIQTDNNSEIILNKDSIRIYLALQKFDSSNYKLIFNKEYKDWLTLINNKQFWGTDGGIPNTQYMKIEVQIGTRKLSLPKVSIDDLFEVSLYNTRANYDQTNDVLFIQSLNSDGAGTYEVIWKIEKGKYKERCIVSGF